MDYGFHTRHALLDDLMNFVGRDVSDHVPVGSQFRLGRAGMDSISQTLLHGFALEGLDALPQCCLWNFPVLRKFENSWRFWFVMSTATTA